VSSQRAGGYCGRGGQGRKEAVEVAQHIGRNEKEKNRHNHNKKRRAAMLPDDWNFNPTKKKSGTGPIG
jgi:hypothetical protein